MDSDVIKSYGINRQAMALLRESNRLIFPVRVQQLFQISIQFWFRFVLVKVTSKSAYKVPVRVSSIIRKNIKKWHNYSDTILILKR